MKNSDNILYHYPASPYAEKVRLMAGYLGVPWCSVDVPIQPPRETLALAGGYRRIPVAQIGADVYCDTALISEQIDSLADKRLAEDNSRSLLADWRAAGILCSDSTEFTAKNRHWVDHEAWF